MVDAKKKRKSKKTPLSKKKSLKEIQTYLGKFEKDEMLDDHGHMIVGVRNQEPIHDDSED